MTLKAKKLGWDPVPMGQFVKALPGIDQSAFSGETPDRVTTDGHDAYPRAMREELGVTVKHRTNRYLNNWIEQDHDPPPRRAT